MKEVCVITGGGSGMGLAAAKYMPKEKIIVISGRTVRKLESAICELKELGYEAYACACDVSKRESVQDLVRYASSLGNIRNVIHSAGVSPAMADKETIVRINALGTVYINQEFAKAMKPGSVIVDVSSNSAYVLPKFLKKPKMYAVAETDEALFMNKMLRIPRMLKNEYNSNGLAYAYSKNFVLWYAQKSAFEYGGKGIRVVSLSPGLIDTDMGHLEAEAGSDLIAASCEKRMGKPEELGFAIAAAADERNGFLAGVDILCDGGSTAGKKISTHPLTVLTKRTIT